MYRAAFVAEVVPGLILVASAFGAALPAFRVMRQSTGGRARSAMAWISGFLVGLMAATLLCVTLGNAADAGSPVAAGGLLGAFLGPFIGVARAKWLGPVKKKRRAPGVSEIIPR
jgi:hypothetical protein